MGMRFPSPLGQSARGSKGLGANEIEYYETTMEQRLALNEEEKENSLRRNRRKHVN